MSAINELRHLSRTVSGWIIRGLSLVGFLSLSLTATAQTTGVGLDPGFKRFMATTTGSNVTIGFGSTGVPVVATSSPGLPTGNGWTQAGNFGVSQQGDRVAFGTTGKIDLPGGGKLAANVQALATRPSVGKAAAKFLVQLSGPLSLGIAGYELIKALGLKSEPKAEGGNRILQNTGGCSGGVGYVASLYGGGYPSGVRCSEESAANDTFDQVKAVQSSCTFYGDPCTWSLSNLGGGAFSIIRNGYSYLTIYTGQTAAPSGDPVEVSESQLADMIAQSMGAPTGDTARTVAEAVKKGLLVDLEKASVTAQPSQPDMATKTKVEITVKFEPAPTATDPNAVRKIETTTTTKTVPSASILGDTVTSSPQVVVDTSTKTTEPDGSQSTKTSTSVTSSTSDSDPAPPDTDLCKLHPEILACAGLDTPTEQVPKANREVTYTPEAIGNAGSCPADVSIWPSKGLNFSYARACSILAGPVKVIVLLISTFTAFMILMPGRGGDL